MRGCDVRSGYNFVCPNLHLPKPASLNQWLPNTWRLCVHLWTLSELSVPFVLPLFTFPSLRLSWCNGLMLRGDSFIDLL